MSKHDRYYRHPLGPPVVVEATCTQCPWTSGWTFEIKVGEPIDSPHERARRHIEETDHSVNETTLQSHRFNGQ